MFITSQGEEGRREVEEREREREREGERETYCLGCGCCVAGGPLVSIATTVIVGQLASTLITNLLSLRAIRRLN